MFSENRCENNQILFSILDSTKLVFNVSWLAEVGDLVSLNFQLITDHKSTKQSVKSRLKPQFLQTAVSGSTLFSDVYVTELIIIIPIIIEKGEIN